ncbi:aminotransferase class I/II-fold pyridoxal phosphate-dependent enzyme [Steroidobacter sp.]|uniref:aminotransferase class I/II-fold pyridoxal phosphate-dependent enzyme n=1 Tax=Steroidobacter sp. TaxID=1978227 RepID=UPI001A6352F3|nr:8-amino-7-oxononanoate synthase [Steroidobacter sp.]MBL8271522.1 8-amino-7-oxononanoate synthase [Steroidobacter sp.]
MTDWNAWAERELAGLRAIDRYREPVPFDGDGPAGTVRDKLLTSFASNDYLGLASHPEVRRAAIDAIERFGTGALASRLIVGTRTLHVQLESQLAEWKHAERALVFSSGYAANLGVLTALGEADVTLFSDALNHASIIDGCRLAKARSVIYRHLDLEHLQSLLRQTPGRKIVVTESVFSMDGDTAPLSALAQLCIEHSALLVIDGAHAALGPELESIYELQVLHVGTLSKTLGSLGGFVAGSGRLIELLVNRARTFIFTTGLSPADTAAASAAVRIYRSQEGDRLRTRLRSHIDMLRPGHPSAIVPIVLGEDAAALAAASQLREIGIHVPAIRPPTVPKGTARLRVALSASHTESMIRTLQDALAKLNLS